MTTESFLKENALDLGACLVGIAPAEPDPAESSRLGEWLAAGRHGSMGYMEREPERRADARLWFPEARSIVMLGFSYWNPEPVPAGDSERGRIARYAVGKDYHPVLKARLGMLLERLRKRHPEANGLPFVDASPVLERAYARLAGIGWIGKNTMLLSRDSGSFFFLAGLALDLPLRPDTPETGHCGTCTRCLDACPTDAFPRPFELDASRCIAYFTIEKRGAVPPEFRDKTGDWVFGCDICQDVCPWNRFSNPTKLSEFAPTLPLSIPLEDLLSITPAEFREVYKKTPMERARRRGLTRNVLLAMGNSGNPAFAGHLERFSRDDDPVLAEQATWSLSRLRDLK